MKFSLIRLHLITSKPINMIFDRYQKQTKDIAVCKTGNISVLENKKYVTGMNIKEFTGVKVSKLSEFGFSGLSFRSK